MLSSLIYRWEHKLAQSDGRVVMPFEWGIEFLSDTGLSVPLPTGCVSGVANCNSMCHVHWQAIVEFNQRAIAESDIFFKSAPLCDFSFDGEWLMFKSQVTTPYEENNTVYGRYFPSRSKGSKSCDRERSRGRAVLVLPHWNAKPQEHVALCRWLNRAGIAALRLSLPYHDRRQPPGLERADYMVSPNIGRTLQACRQAVLDARAAIDWLVAQGYERIGILGTSLGSCIAFLTSVHEERIRVGIYNHVSSYFGDVVWKGITTAHVRRGLEKALTAEQVRQVWMAISPYCYIDRWSRYTRRALLISARYDLSFTPDLSQLLFDEMDRLGANYDKALLHCGHYSMGKFPFKYYVGYLIVNYFHTHL
jgi:hypothetical protein